MRTVDKNMKPLS